MSVLFPAPDGPMSAHISPACSVTSTLSRMRVPPADTPTLFQRRGPRGRLKTMSSWKDAQDTLHDVRGPAEFASVGIHGLSASGSRTSRPDRMLEKPTPERECK